MLGYARLCYAMLCYYAICITSHYTKLYQVTSSFVHHVLLCHTSHDCMYRSPHQWKLHNRQSYCSQHVHTSIVTCILEAAHVRLLHVEIAQDIHDPNWIIQLRVV